MLHDKDDPKPYIVSVCAGSNQISLITEAKNLGYNVIGIDQNIDAPGLRFCDIIIQESILNYNSIYKKLRKMPINIVGVITRSYGAAVITTAFLAEKFKIPYIGRKKLNHFYDKTKLKETFSKLSIKSPGVRASTNSKLGVRAFINNLTKTGVRASFPIVIKPTQGHAKKGVMKIESNAELAKYFDEYTNTKEKFLIEEYINGQEIICVGLVILGKFNLIEITDKVTSPPPAFIDILHTAPSVYEYKKSEITTIGQKLADHFKIINSPIIMEFIVDSNNELYIIEAVPEFGGEYLCDILIPLRYNYNIFKEFIKAQTGEQTELPNFNSDSDAAAIKYITGQGSEPPNKQKILDYYNSKSVCKIPEIKYFKMFIELGQKVNEPKSNHDRIGVIVSQANSLEKALSSIKLAEKCLALNIGSEPNTNGSDPKLKVK